MKHADILDDLAELAEHYIYLDERAMAAIVARAIAEIRALRAELEAKQ